MNKDDNIDGFIYDSYERDEVTYPALLVVDILATMRREYGVRGISYTSLMDISNHCLNFIYNKMPNTLDIDNIVIYVGTALPKELVENKHKLLKDAQDIMKNHEDIQRRAEVFMELRTLFTLAIIEELQFASYIEPSPDKEKLEDHFLIRNFTHKSTYGIVNYNIEESYKDVALNTEITITSVSTYCEHFNFTIRSLTDDRSVIKGECEIIGLITPLMINKYFTQTGDYSMVLTTILNMIDSLPVKNIIG